MQVDLDKIADMQLPELDELRHRLRLTRKEVCRKGDFNPSTYSRWMNWLQGEPNGSRPHPRSIRVLRDVLTREVERQNGGASRAA